MKNVWFVILIFCLFFFKIDKVFAVEAGSNVNRNLVYKITSVDIQKDYTTLKGYAYIDKHNNHHFSYLNNGEKGITLMEITAFDGTTSINPKELNFYDGNLNGYTYDPNAVCWEAGCYQNSDGTWSFTNPTHPYTEPTNLSSCLYKHVFFTAKFDTRTLRNKSNIKFKIKISYDLEHEVRPCVEQENGRTTNGYIYNNINNNVPIASYWGGSAYKSIDIKKVSSCKVGTSNCSSNSQLDYGVIVTKVNVTNNGSEFKLSFNTKEKNSASIINKNKKVDKNLECTDANFYSASLEKAETKYELTAGTGICQHSESVTISADYVIIESGVLRFDLYRGPIYAGGAFGFKVDYINTAKWYYVNDVPECPLITVTGVNPVTKCESGTCIIECEGSITGYDERCNEDGESKIRFEQEIKKKYIPLNKNGVSYPSVKLEMDNNNNSNSVNNPVSVNDIGEWICENPPEINGDWKPNTEWTTKCTYRLKESKLNRMTADVKYNNNACSGSEICKDNMYYVPLKWNEETFNVFIDFGRINDIGLSTINGINWHIDYTCDVEVKQMLYNINDKGYLFFYRPIDLNNPFPDREPSTNWLLWWEDNINKEALANGYDNLEYSVALNPNDMRDIKNYNREKLYNSGENLGYLDYSINEEGRSSFVTRYMQRYSTDNNRLGEVR